MPVLSNYTDTSQDAFQIDFLQMLKDEKFGEPPNPFAMSFIRLLREKGFRVTPTPKEPKPGNTKQTLHIMWNGYVIGLMSKTIWGRKKPYACLFRRMIMEGGEIDFIDNVLPDFDKVAFALEHGCDLNQLRVNPDSKKLYLWVQGHETSLRLMQDSARRINEVFSPRGSQETECIQADLRAIEQDPSITPAQRLAYRDARLGQGKFRKDLEDEFGYACSVTRLAAREVLRASHIVPWSKSSRKQQIDAKNGLLLSANIDALFDRYMITFRPDGKLDVSKFITQTDLERLGPMQDLQRKPCGERAKYLKRHNAEFDRFERFKQEQLVNVKSGLHPPL